MKVSLGRTVITFGVVDSNGSKEHPAIVTRVWSDKDLDEGSFFINLTVFPDCDQPRPQGSVRMFNDRASAMAWRESSPHDMVAFFPDRV